MTSGARVRRNGLRVLALLAALGAGTARAAWVVNQDGECVHSWTSGALLRGPSAILNAPLVPMRSAVGGALVARDDRNPGGLRRKLLLTPALTVAGGGMGLVESGIWLGSGLGDTLTGGYFALAPEEATALSVEPMRPLFVADAQRTGEDRCGRALPQGPR